VTFYSVLAQIAGLALIITLLRYFLAKPSNILLCYLQNFIGVFFIYSGFVKAVDPLGFSYKLEEYFEVFAESAAGISWLISLLLWFKGLSLALSVFMTVLEMALGWMLIFGIFIRLTTWLMLLLILFFTFLTGYSWYTGKITDCGCFGDAIHFTNAETFWKDVALTVLILIIFFYRRKITPVFRPVGSNIMMVIGVAASIYLPVYCLRHLPIIDFRPYAIGNNIRKQMTLPPGVQPDQYVSILIYKDKTSGKEGKYVMISNNENQQPWFKDRGLRPLPWQDSVWMANHEFVDSKSELVQAGEKPKITDFHVWDDNNTDMTAAVLDAPSGYHFWVVAYDMEKANAASFEKLNQLAVSSEKNNIPLVALTATPYQSLDPIRHELNAAFPFYYADATVLKTIVRSNPGLVLLKGPVVVDMWHYNDFPTFEEVSRRHLK
jgi:uncharacterized membrane protein YphA (DoxX/SURF4 family)